MVKRKGGVLVARAKKKRELKVNLEQYIKQEKKRSYMTYAKAAEFYSLPYYGMVRLAKAADANWKVRRTAIVDLDKVDFYLEELRKGELKDGK